MIVKNAIKEEIDFFNNKMGDKDYPGFIQDLMVDYQKHSTKEYGEMVKLGKLNSLLPERLVIEQNSVIKKVEKLSNKLKLIEKLWGGSIFLFVGSGIALYLSSLFINGNEPLMFKWIFGWTWVVLLVSSLFYTIGGVTVKIKEENLKKYCNDIKVKDQDGNSVKLIWLMYHNTTFEKESDKEKFLNKYYQKYNHDLIISATKCLNSKVEVEGYLESLKPKS